MGYVVPADAPNPHVDLNGFLARALGMQQIEVYAKDIDAKHALFLFDSCFSGSMFALSRAVPENISYKTGKPVRQFITSGSADEKVPDVSIFRGQFVSALEGEADHNRDGYVTGVELGQFLQDTVINYTRGAQHPQYGKIRHPRLDKGDFVFIADAGEPEAVVTLEPTADTGGVRVETRPAGASVWVNSERRGKTPLKLLGLEPGKLWVRAAMEGFETVEQQVWIRAGKTTTVSLVLDRITRTGRLSITSDPPQADWYLDSAYAGTTPDAMARVAQGKHEIEVLKAGYKKWSQTVTVQADSTLDVKARLELARKLHALTVEIKPADARVRILNIKPKYHPGIRLRPGRYHIEVSKPGYRMHKEWVTVTDLDLTVAVNLNRKPSKRETAVTPLEEQTHQAVTPPVEQAHQAVVQVSGRSHGERTRTVSGFFVDHSGHIVTNAHVVQGLENIRVTLHDGSSHPVDLLGQDPATDVAVLKIPRIGEVMPTALGRFTKGPCRGSGHCY